jgi:2',3'-cyclic-nucleotide 2'-phosphodiesterase (5'-nucleotidase family)
MPGFTKRHTLLKELSYHKNTDVLIETGDYLEKKYDLNKSKAILESYTLAGYHSINLGLNEYYYGSSFIQSGSVKSSPIHSSNVKIKAFFSNQSIGKEFLILQRSGKKIGILSIASQGVLKLMNPKTLDALSIREPVQQIETITSANQADLWIINYYGKLSEAKELADKFPTAIIISGYEKLAPPKEGYTKTGNGNFVYHLAGEGELLGFLTIDIATKKVVSVKNILPDYDKTLPSKEITDIMTKYNVKE